MELLEKDYVLVQAWKKTSSYMRYHNWFSDTLALDMAAVNLPQFLAEIRERLTTEEPWQPDPLRMVLAPKNQRWRVDTSSLEWKPDERDRNFAPLRPLAHVSLKDQVVATAVLLCLADRVETQQGDTNDKINSEKLRKGVISYGNRLFCDKIEKKLRHRWGSIKLYRSYYQDYRKFITRPQEVAAECLKKKGSQVFIVESDLRQFYDRVRPASLATAIDGIKMKGDDSRFFDFAKSVLNWTWNSDDGHEVGLYQQQSMFGNFNQIALPQGLVAAGFFANVVLLTFDAKLQRNIGKEIEPGMSLVDVCRYVDDLRLVVVVDSSVACCTDNVEHSIANWLGEMLKGEVPTLELSSEKTRAIQFGADHRPLIRQSTRMNRIQSAVSGGFDVIGGEEILDAIRGLIHPQDPAIASTDGVWRLAPIPDVRDETVARFAAGRFRTTFRSLRPMLEERVGEIGDIKESDSDPFLDSVAVRARITWTQNQLDEDAKAFALGLIHRWVDNPSNVRLLRVGLDLWPDVEVLQEVLSLLRPYTLSVCEQKAPQRVAWYCLSEILRIGATETGLVSDEQSLPANIDLQKYRRVLCDEAVRIAKLSPEIVPWYLRQQALLFVATVRPLDVKFTIFKSDNETQHYLKLIRFLFQQSGIVESEEFATFAILARRTFLNRTSAVSITRPKLNVERARKIAEKDPSFALELLDNEKLHRLTPRLLEDLCIRRRIQSGKFISLAELVLRQQPNTRVRNELFLLDFAVAFLRNLTKQKLRPTTIITPTQVELLLNEDLGIAEVQKLRIRPSRVRSPNSLYMPPDWSIDKDRWRFQLGYLLRFVLSGNADFTRFVRPPSWKEERECVYRAAENHWFQRRYGLFSGQPAFGDDWLPISDWMESFLFALLRWPGCGIGDEFAWVDEGIDDAIASISKRVSQLRDSRGRATGLLMLRMKANRPISDTITRSLRGCVVQTVVPNAEDFDKNDLGLNGLVVRKRHRRHLSATLAAVERMLGLRGTHEQDGQNLDLLILPELAVHRDDVRTHLVPFARTHKAIVLTGITYEHVIPNQPLINSALWVIPEWTHSHGLQVRTRRQGKQHLAPIEETFNQSTQLIRGFRPCQWLIGYPWSKDKNDQPVWLSASVCYDATDLGLAADLREKSDVLAVPALNKDVKTFDQMALALHYHMFQLVIVANNGTYGGSNAYWPKRSVEIRQVFHTYGQPQASISFFEIDNISEFLNRSTPFAPKDWKYPPANLS